MTECFDHNYYYFTMIISFIMGHSSHSSEISRSHYSAVGLNSLIFIITFLNFLTWEVFLANPHSIFKCPTGWTEQNLLWTYKNDGYPYHQQIQFVHFFSTSVIGYNDLKWCTNALFVDLHIFKDDTRFGISWRLYLYWLNRRQVYIISY